MGVISKRTVNKAVKGIREEMSSDEGYPEWWEFTGFTKEELDFSWVLCDKR